MNVGLRTKVVVYVQGGLVADVVADSEDIEVMVVDYDNEKESGEPERHFERVMCDPELVQQTSAATEPR